MLTRHRAILVGNIYQIHQSAAGVPRHAARASTPETEWPPIGLYCWVWQRNHPCSVRELAAYGPVLAAFIICTELGAICVGGDVTIYRQIGGGIGIGLLWFYARPIRQEVVDTELDTNYMTDRIDKLETMVEATARNLRPDLFGHPPQDSADGSPTATKPPASVTHLRVVPRAPEPPGDGDEPDSSG